MHPENAFVNNNLHKCTLLSNRILSGRKQKGYGRSIVIYDTFSGRSSWKGAWNPNPLQEEYFDLLGKGHGTITPCEKNTLIRLNWTLSEFPWNERGLQEEVSDALAFKFELHIRGCSNTNVKNSPGGIPELQMIHISLLGIRSCFREQT